MKNQFYLFLSLLLFSTYCNSQGIMKDTILNEIIDLAYHNKDDLQRLNLIIPSNQQHTPLLVWIGGGAWSYVDRNQEMNLGRRIAQAGITFASIGHRLSPATFLNPPKEDGIQHPSHVEDVAIAIKWLIDNAEEYGYSDQQIFIGGFSSGAHLSALLCMDDRYLKVHGLTKELIKGVIPIGGAYDILHYHQVFKNGSSPHLAEQHVEAVFGSTEQEMIEASPTSYLDSLSVPMLIISENRTYKYAVILEEKLRATNFSDWDIVHINNMGHGELWRHMSNDEKSTYRDLLISFIHNRT